MPNDAISREAAIEAVEDKFDLYGELTSYTQVTAAIASLPADTRWEEEIRKLVGEYRLSIERELGHADNGDEMLSYVLLDLEKLLDRLAPAPAEDVPKRPPMLLAAPKYADKSLRWWFVCNHTLGRDVWRSAEATAINHWSEELNVNRDHSDPEALRLYDQDIAEAQH